jgi:translocator protein
MKLNNPLKFIIAIAIPQLAGFIGSIFTTQSVSTWYTTLEKPVLNPPSWVFGPVWITLYFLMGLAVFLVWKKGFENKNVKVALIVFDIQLFLNVVWSILFFGLKRPGTALIEIICLWVTILVTIIMFAKVSRLAAWLLVPYILWVSFATYLNYSLWILN